MIPSLNYLFKDVKINPKKWEVIDLRIDIPKHSAGSDSINPHTQYSNPTCIANINGIEAYGISFTLGIGNDLVTQSIKKLLEIFEGISIYELLEKPKNLFNVFSNPLQLRWLSPNAGCVYMAAGAILNTLLDYAAKKSGLPLWKLLALSSSEDLVRWINDSNYSNLINEREIFNILEVDKNLIKERIYEIENKGLPVYHTTWIGSSIESLTKEIQECYQESKVKTFKLKLSSNNEWNINRLKIIESPNLKDFSFCVDTNQTLSLDTALELSFLLNKKGILWLEEPFAPDNVQLHRTLKNRINNKENSLKIATGENCPNAHLAIDLLGNNGCDIFQVDACRVLSISDLIPILCAAKKFKKEIIPHAGGSGLDELVPHIQAFYLARINNLMPIEKSLMENIGFCSRFFKYPSKIIDGKAKAPYNSGYLGGFSDLALSSFNNKESEVWLKF